MVLSLRVSIDSERKVRDEDEQEKSKVHSIKQNYCRVSLSSKHSSFYTSLALSLVPVFCHLPFLSVVIPVRPIISSFFFFFFKSRFIFTERNSIHHKLYLWSVLGFPVGTFDPGFHSPKALESAGFSQQVLQRHTGRHPWFLHWPLYKKKKKGMNIL